MSEIFYIDELPEVISPVDLKIFNQHQQKDTSLMAKYKPLNKKAVFFVEEIIIIATS